MLLCHTPKVLFGGLIRWIKNKLAIITSQFVSGFMQFHLFTEQAHSSMLAPLLHSLQGSRKTSRARRPG